jgi:hypothetical protein
VRLRLPASAKGNIDFNSFSGRFESDLPVTLNNGNRRLPRRAERRRQRRLPVEGLQRRRFNPAIKAPQRHGGRRPFRRSPSGFSLEKVSLCLVSP